MNAVPSDTLAERLKAIRLLLLDVDGVLTDGSIVYDDAGSEIKTFNVRDGLGVRLLMLAGIQVGIATGRRSKALLHRCANLKITMIFDGLASKSGVLAAINAQAGISANEIAYIGDDLMDISLMQKVGVSIAVADAHPLVISAAHLVSSFPGGKGAVREVCEMILKARGLWDDMLLKVV